MTELSRVCAFTLCAFPGEIVALPAAPVEAVQAPCTECDVLKEQLREALEQLELTRTMLKESDKSGDECVRLLRENADLKVTVVAVHREVLTEGGQPRRPESGCE